MFAPTSKWKPARRQPYSHHSRNPFDLEGQGAEARHLEKRKRLCLPDKQMEDGEEAAPLSPHKTTLDS